jgi:hypothetical protein
MSQPFRPPGEHDPPPAPALSGPEPYGPRPYATPPDHPRGVLVLVLGILSVATCGLLGPVAWGLGDAALRDIDADPSAYGNRGTVLAGKICGIIGTAILAIDILFVALLFVLSRDA